MAVREWPLDQARKVVAAGGAPSEKRYNLNVSINFQNLLNRVNLAPPVGNLASPNFGESLGLGGAFGGFGGRRWE